MKYITFFTTILFLILCHKSIAQNQIVGKWFTVEKNSIVEIYRSHGKYFGKIISVANHAKTKLDVNNPDPKLKDRSLENVIILKDLVYVDDEWKQGTIYNPVNGRTYDCKLWLKKGQLMVRGYLGIFYSTQVWERKQ